MTLTPEEIVSYELKQTVRGYSVAQVDELLDRLADQVEAAQLEQARLTDRLHAAEARLEATQETESTLNRTLVTAQQAAERTVQEAREEADALLARAREEADRIEQDARAEAERVLAEAQQGATREAEEARRRRAALQERIDELEQRERRYRQHLRELLETQLTDLEQLEDVDASGPAAPGDTAAVAGPEEQNPPGGERHGLKVRVHDRGADDQDPESPLGSPTRPGEE